MRQEQDTSGCGGCLAVFLVLIAVSLVFVAVAWFVSLVGHALGLTPTYPEFDRHDAAWIHEHYDLVGLGYVLTVLALVAGVPASIAITVELWKERPDWRWVSGLSAMVVALVFAIAFAPAGPSH